MNVIKKQHHGLDCLNNLSQSTGEMSVSLFSVKELSSNFDYYSRYLSEAELHTAHQFYFEKDKMRYVISHGVLREVLSRKLGVEPQSLEFGYNIYGKPYVLGFEIDFNLSHTDDLCLVAYSITHKIGVDIENIITDKSCCTLANHYFSLSEQSYLASHDLKNLNEAFCQLWVAKEATVKAIGRGLHLPLNVFSINIEAERLNFHGTYKHYGQSCKLSMLSVPRPYCAAYVLYDE